MIGFLVLRFFISKNGITYFSGLYELMKYSLHSSEMPVTPCQLMLLCAGDKASTEGCRCGVQSVDGNGRRRPYQQVSSQQRMMGSRLQSWEGFEKTLQIPGSKLLERQVGPFAS